ncbi:choice-of-anchor R domain-containing protein [Maridesulfovibrio sp.]|uniref:choice-of-anchor R domain-containing protein n=1 Tax=Maridesulfovibrio sp. TaxID=2795000 RepID=UPI002A18D29B|nr:choice-of-anchor R domain-containing protein [Maridesulfovibrio sp.]
MTVVSSGNTITFAGDGVQNSFDFNFRIFRAEDLCAVLRNSDGTEDRLVLGNDFKIVSGVGSDSGGRVQYPISGTPLPAGQSITLYREIAYTQELELVDNDPFSAQLLNEAFDRGVMRDQQLQEQVDRALKYEISTPEAERLTPQEMVQTISNARDEAVSARSGAIAAEGNAQGMLVDARAAQTGSEAARDKALLAQSAAEEARDSAIKIAVGDLSALRSSTPELSAPSEAFEGTTVSIVITDHIDDGITSYEIKTSGFGYASISGNTISWVLETSDTDVAKVIEVTRRRRGELYSDAAAHQLLIKHVSVQDGPTIAFADAIDGYPGASVDSEGVHTPAYSVSVENAAQVVSAKPEIVVVNGKLIVLDGTTESILKLAVKVAAGDLIITDKGEVVVTDFTSSGVTVQNSTTLQPNSKFTELAGVPFTERFVDTEGWSEQFKIMPVGGVSSSVETARTLANIAGMYMLFHIKDWTVLENPHGYGYLGVMDTYCTDTASTYQVITIMLHQILGSSTGVGLSCCFGTRPDGVPDLVVSDMDMTKETWVLMSIENGQVTYGFKYGDKDNRPSSVSDLNASKTFTATPLNHQIERAAVVGDFYGYPVKTKIRHVEYGLSTYAKTESVININRPLPGVPTKAFKNPFKTPLGMTASTLSSVTVADKVVEGETLFALLSDGWHEVAAGTITTETAGSSEIVYDTRGLDFINASFTFSSGSYSPVGVKFTPSKNTTLTSVILNLESTGAAVLSASIFSDNNGVPGSELVAYGATVSVSTPGDVEVPIPEYELQAGTPYWVQVENTGAAATVKATNQANVVTSRNGGLLTTQLMMLALKAKGISYNVDISSAGLSAAPTSIAKASGLALKIGAGVAGEYLGPKKVLSLKKASALPVMTAATTNGFTLSSGGTSVPAPWAPWNAADGDLNTLWQRSSTNEEPQLVVEGPFTGPVTRIDIQARSSASEVALKRLPKDFTIEGYNGSSWEVLKTVTGEIGWQSEEKRSFSFANGANCQKYKVNISATETDGDVYREIGELALFYEDSSSKTEVVVESEESVKDQILKTGGLHKTLLFDGQLVEVDSVSEIEDGYVEGGSLIPVLSSNTQDGITVSASVVGQEPYLSTVETVGSTGWTAGAGQADWFIEFPSPVLLFGYSLWGPNNATNVKYYHPRTWELAGLASDGTTWETIDSKVDQPNWVAGEQRDYVVSPTKAYTKFRMRCSNNEAGDNQIGLGKIQMWSAVTAYKTTIIPKTELAQIPTEVAIPDRCTLAPANYSNTFDGNGLKITGAEIALADNPALKRLVMAVSGEGVTFKSGKIYIKEKP